MKLQSNSFRPLEVTLRGTRIRRFLLAAGFVAISNLSLNASVHQAYVSSQVPPGAQQDGSRTQPYSIENAFRQETLATLDKIILLDGTYELNKPIVICENRPYSTPLEIEAENPGRAILSGGTRLDHSTDREGVHSFFDIGKKEGLHLSNDLYIAQTRATRARSITYEAATGKFSALPWTVESVGSELGYMRFANSPRILDHNSRPLELGAMKQGESLDFLFRCAWWEKRIRASLTTDNTLQFAQPGWDAINTPWGTENTSRLNATMPKKTILSGHPQLLDSDGEWYVSGNTITVQLPDELAREPITIGRLESLLQIRNSHSISLVGITFSHSTWKLPIDTHGFNEGQANWEQIGQTLRPPMAVTVASSEQIAFRDCQFSQLGGIGMGIVDASSKIEISDCRFIDTAANAVVIGTIDINKNYEDDLVSEVTFSRNWIHSPASVFKSGVGIFVGFAKQVSIQDNEICHAPYSGISIGWGWGEVDPERNNATGSTIENNHVHHYLYDMYDGGGIYSLGPQSNTTLNWSSSLQIICNTIHNQGGLGNILYSDGGSRWVELRHNKTFDNLREIDHYYEGRDRYNADWGGVPSRWGSYF